jgi:hypothetical protein
MPDRDSAAGEDSVAHGAHLHTHPGLAHSHPHRHGEDRNHHGPAFGKKRVVEVAEAPEPVEIVDFTLVRQLRDSIAAEEAKRREHGN